MDVDALIRGTPQEAVGIRGLGRELLEGMEFGNSPAFETWLLGERRRLLDENKRLREQIAALRDEVALAHGRVRELELATRTRSAA